MKHLYLVRHGTPDYQKNVLTEYGIEQVRCMSAKLEEVVPRTPYITLVSSPSNRAIQTAQGFQPMLAKKKGSALDVVVDGSFHELSGWAISFESAIEKGMKFMPAIEGYLSEADVVVLTAHEKLNAMISSAVTRRYDIPFSDSFGPKIKEPDDPELLDVFADYLKRKGLPYSKDDAIACILKRDFDLYSYAPDIPICSAVCFDLEAKTVEMILPE